MIILQDPSILHSEISFRASRSGGKGGQNVNKVSAKVELLFDVKNSVHLSEEQKQKVWMRLQNRINSEGILQIISQTERSQYANKLKALEQFDRLIRNAFIEKKKRIATKISKAAKERRLQSKKILSEKKQMRRRLE